MSETVAPVNPVAASPVQPQAPVTDTATTVAPTLATDQGQAPAPVISSETSALTAGIEKPAAEGEAKPEGEAKAEDAAPEPIKYEDFKLPEGTTAEDPLLASFIETASVKGLSQETAQAVIDALGPKVSEALQAPYREWEAQQTAWLKEINDDATIGGANLAPTQQRIGRLLADPNFVDAGFAAAMNATGAGNHPAVIRTFAKLAARLTEGEPVRQGAPAQPPKSMAEKLYPNLPVR